MRSILMAVVVTLLMPTFAQAEGVQNGREYTRRMREIEERRKQIATHERDAQRFDRQLVELDALQLPQELKLFNQTTTTLREMMEQEYRRALEAAGLSTVQKATTVPSTEVITPEAKRHEIDRMAAIMRETEGLEYWINAGEFDARGRHRALLGEFIDLVRADIAAGYARANRDEKALAEGDWD